MGIKRVVDVDFWTDEKVMDTFTPEDKLFFIYLLTNPHTTQLGIYAINPKYIYVELGYSIDSVKVLLDRFENQYGIIKYSKKTQEIAVKNFLKHSIVKGGAPVRDCLIRELKAVKNKELINFVFAHIKQYENLNKTVRDIIEEYEELNGEIVYCYDKRKNAVKENNDNVNDNENENENEVSCNDSSNDSLPSQNVEEPKRKRYERKRFVPPTLEEIQAYCLERKNNVDAKKFYDYFTASGWYDSKGNKVKSWKQKVITWEGYGNNSKPKQRYADNPANNVNLDDLF